MDINSSKIIVHFKGSFLKIKEMEKEFIFRRKEIATKDSLKIILNMGMELNILKKDSFIKGIY